MTNYEPVGFQVAASPQQQQQAEQQRQQEQRRRKERRPHLSKDSLKEFVVDDVKLFFSPVVAMANEFVRELKR